MDTQQAAYSMHRQVVNWEDKSIMGVFYRHFMLENGDDLYLTEYGIPFFSFLTIANLTTGSSRTKLSGTSGAYRMSATNQQGKQRDFVLKWNRMGQDIPGGTHDEDLGHAEFNSPFEEFSLLFELRNSREGLFDAFLTHRPLAIYVPSSKCEPWQLNRRPYRMEAKQAVHSDITLHSERTYAVIYEWIKGIDAYQVFKAGNLEESELHTLYKTVKDHLSQKGFQVLDHKSSHIIVRPDAHGKPKRRADGHCLYAYVDFELLERTPDREKDHQDIRRKLYLHKQAHRFSHPSVMPPHLTGMRIMGVDYICGRIESTGGSLFVVGHDPDLFEYFLPEKWRRTARTKLSSHNQIYHTTTKDNIQLVWKVSRVGEMPSVDPFVPKERDKLRFGYNSPFEEFSLSLYLAKCGVDATYPRAIYRTTAQHELSAEVLDARRYQSHAHLIHSDGSTLLSPDYTYIMIWGYWNGQDEMLAEKDVPYAGTVSALRACQQQLITQEMYLQLMKRMKKKLSKAGVEDFNLRGGHILLTTGSDGKFVKDRKGIPTMRICNFELLRRK